ncbi:MAG: ABC transporter permease [Planctomycetota bacterium]
MNNLFRDIKYSTRQLIKSPGFTAVAVLTLALGIGANTTIFSLINGVLFRPFPGQREGELIRLYSGSNKPDGGFRMFSYPYYRELRDQNTSFASLSAFVWTAIGIREQDVTRRAGAGFVTADFFNTFGVRVARGRSFTPDESAPGSRVPVAIASHRLWQRHGADPDLLGKGILLNDVQVTIVGVLPQSFVSASLLTNWDVWLPLGMLDAFSRQPASRGRSRLDDHGYRKLFVLGQLKPGLTKATVQPELDTLARRLAQAYPEEYQDCRLIAGPMAAIRVSPMPGGDLPFGRPMVALLAVSGIVLLIACMNLANMFLARGLGRRREIGIRLALGSSRRRIVQQLLTEGGVLSVLGGVAGVILALWMSQILVQSLERMTGGEGTIPIGLDARILGATAVLCLLSTLLFALGPAWRLSRVSAIAELKESMGSAPPRRTLGRQSLVAAQIALAFVLVTCAGLFVRSAGNAMRTDPGFALEQGLIAELDLRFLHRDQQRGAELYRVILDRLRGMPGVETVSLAWSVPFDNTETGSVYQRADVPAGTPKGAVSSYVNVNVIGADYFKALDVNLLRGREFNHNEEQLADGPRVAVIDDLLAQRLWPGEDPTGQYLRSGGDRESALQIVGVVPYLRENIIERRTNPHVYLPFGQHYRSDMHVHLRLRDDVTEASQVSLISMIRRELRALDPALPVLSIRTWDQHRVNSMEFWAMRMGARLFAALGLSALILAAVGLFGVKSYLAAQRTREIGIRMALGATRNEVIFQVLREGLALVLVGLGMGMLLAFISTRFLQRLLFEVGGTDPLVLAAAALTLATTILLASFLPARRAVKVKPMDALRYE